MSKSAKEPHLTIEERIRIAIQRYEEDKRKGKFDRLLSGDADLLLRALKAAGLTTGQIECATQAEQNIVLIKQVIEFFAKKGIKVKGV